VVVELFAVGKFGVAPMLGADGDLIRAVPGDGRFIPGGSGVVEERPEAAAFEFRAGREAAEVDEGGVEVEEFDGAFTLTARFGDAGGGDSHDNAAGAFPQGELTPLLLFA
jgi:hypothetical protein